MEEGWAGRAGPSEGKENGKGNKEIQKDGEKRGVHLVARMPPPPPKPRMANFSKRNQV